MAFHHSQILRLRLRSLEQGIPVSGSQHWGFRPIRRNIRTCCHRWYATPPAWTFARSQPPSSPSSSLSSTPTYNQAVPRQPPITTTRAAPPLSPTKPPSQRPSVQPHNFEAQGLSDQPPLDLTPSDSSIINWSTSFSGLSSQPFAAEVAEVLTAPLNPNDVELKPDGIIYLPEIKYRRILNRAFGPGGWGLAPRSETIITSKNETGGQGLVTREYALVAHGRLISVARGEQSYFATEGIPTATEGCKSNALMRCCKDLGLASELWDPRFIQKWVKEWGREVWVENVMTKKRRKIWRRKDDEVKGPFKEVKL